MRERALFDSRRIREILGIPAPPSTGTPGAGTGAAEDAVGEKRGEPVPPEGDLDSVHPSPREGSVPRAYTTVAIDSRDVASGALFVALAGERHHGMDFLEDVEAAGALGAVVPADRLEEARERAPELEAFPARDTLRALGDLAAARRREAGAEVVGVTGSSGKTTVKEMIHHALSGPRRSYRTAGNLNSLSGLPLAIFRAPDEADVWVLELGANRPGEIARLAEIAAPDHAVVTTVGAAHLEAFGDVEGVMREKLALVEAASPDGTVVVGERPPELPVQARALRPDAVVAGVEEGADFRPERHGLEADRVWFERDGARFEVAAGGLHHLRDALMAAAVARALGVEPAETARGLAGFQPLGMRSALRRIGGLTVLVDCYNANPESFGAAIDYCATAFPGRRLAAVVGTMLELGEASPEAHEGVLHRLKEAGFDLVAATGEFAEAAAPRAPRRNGAAFLVAPEPEDPESVWPSLADALRGDEVVLVKGSRGVRLERIVSLLEQRFGEAGAPGGEGRRTDSPLGLGRTESESPSGGVRPPPDAGGAGRPTAGDQDPEGGA